MKSSQKNKLLLLSFLLISACQKAAPANGAVPVQPESQSPNVLTICLGDEPDSLYRYQPMEKSADLVLQAIYDGPIDIVNGNPLPVILDSLPSLEDNSAQFIPVTVNPGDPVVDTQGNITFLQAGVEIFPSGCRDIECAVVHDGESPLEMDQLSAIYKLKPDITWSDGQPVTSADLLFSFEVASDPVTPIDHFYTDLTDSYNALDWLTVEWKGLPGWIVDRFVHFFWAPLPAHIYGIYCAEQLLAQSDISRQPLGWGPYRISKWTSGESIELVRNPFYYRASEGLPRFDKLIFRITNPTGDTNLANLKFDRKPFNHLDYGIGEFEDEIAQNGCDLTTTTADMRDQMTVFNYLLNYYQDPAIQVFRSEETETQFLLFSLDTDRGVAPQQSLAVRKAVSQCIDHGRLVQALSNNLFGVPQLIDIGLPDQLESTLDFLNYASEPAKEDLEAAGWVDHDSNHRTPRISLGIEGISDGREMVMNLLIEQGNETENAATLLQPMLEDCGIGINAIIQPKEVIWNPEEENSLFYGEFDIAFLAWSTPIQDPCLLFAGDQIPDLSKNKFGSNFSRFNNTRVNEICAEFTYQIPTSKLRQLMAELQEIINVELPIVPLYSFSALLTAQKDFCFEGLDETYANELAGIEEFRIIAECP
jgi:peptide/nickel transport system substrate-binding protein